MYKYTVQFNIIRPAQSMLALLQKSQDLAVQIYDDAICEKVGYLIGNYSGYGSYLTRYNSQSRVIEFPLNPSFEMLRLSGDRYISVVDEKLFIGSCLHELAHHVQCHGNTLSWETLNLDAGDSRHSDAAWCYLCSKGWSYFFPDYADQLTPMRLAWGCKHVKAVRQQLSRYLPNVEPAQLNYLLCAAEKKLQHNCEWCTNPFTAKRSDARFCSTKCRTAAHRERQSGSE